MRRIATALTLLAAAALAQDAAEEKMKAKDYEGALAEYDKAIAAAPEDVGPHRGRARALRLLGRYEEATKAYDRAIALAKAPDADLFFERGLARWGLEDHAAAAADLSRAIEIKPSPLLLRVRSDLKRQQYDYEGALADLDRALELGATDLTSLERRGLVKESLRDFAGAMEDYSRLADLAPTHPRPYSLRAAVKLSSGDYEGAIGDYDGAVYNDETDGHAYIGRARARYALGQKEAADADAAKAVEVAPDAGVHFDRGRYYYDTGRAKEAVADLAKSVELDPTGREYARLALFLARAQVGERKAAAEELKAYAAGREEKEDWFSKVAALLCGDMPEESFLAAAKDENKHRTREQECEAFWYAGAVRRLDGDAAKAKEYFERCVATDIRNFIEHDAAQCALRGY
jgi:tetratricopeptide (TPR) repeat protein